MVEDYIDVDDEDCSGGDDYATGGGNGIVKTVMRKALLYRGTPENPAFWERVAFDLPLAAGECRKEANDNETSLSTNKDDVRLGRWAHVDIDHFLALCISLSLPPRTFFSRSSSNRNITSHHLRGRGTIWTQRRLPSPTALVSPRLTSSLR